MVRRSSRLQSKPPAPKHIPPPPSLPSSKPALQPDKQMRALARSRGWDDVVFRSSSPLSSSEESDPQEEPLSIKSAVEPPPNPSIGTGWEEEFQFPDDDKFPDGDQKPSGPLGTGWDDVMEELFAEVEPWFEASSPTISLPPDSPEVGSQFEPPERLEARSPHLPPDSPEMASEPPEILESDLSGSDEYLPSDGPGGPAPLRRKQKQKAGKRVQSSQIDPNQTDQVQRQAIYHDQVEYETKKADPFEWQQVLKDLDVLQPGNYLSEKVVCNYIMDQWWDIRFAPGRRPIYLPFTEVHYLSSRLTAHLLQRGDEEFKLFPFQKLHQSVACRKEDRRVCFFLFRTQSAMDGEQRDEMKSCNHFFPVLFDYDAHKAHVFGIVNVSRPGVKAERASESKWSCWLGPELWQRIAEGMGWGEDVGDPDTNGYDCGIYSLKILRRLTRPDGDEELLDEWTVVGFEGCMHEDRSKVLDWTAEWIHSAMGLYEVQQKNKPTKIRLEGITPLDLTHVRDKSFGGIKQFQEVRGALTRTRLLCPDCIKGRAATMGSDSEQVESGLVLNRPKQRRNRVDGGGKDGENRKNGEDVEDAEDGEDRELGELSDGEEESTIDPRRELLELAQRLGGEVVAGRKEPERKSKPVQPYRFQEVVPHGVVKSFDPDFDSYHTGPTAEMVVEMSKETYAGFQASPAVARWSTVQDRFSDHGYRRTAGGFHQFYLNEPLLEDQLEHLFPLPPEDVLKDWKERRNPTEMNQVDLQWKDLIPEKMIEGNDLEVWTLAQMVGEGAGAEGTEDGMRTYITGKTSSGKFIRLDIHRSRKEVPIEDLLFSVDIDSIIWETDRLKTIGSINLHLLPLKGEKPPISKHNHTYVELYWPRMERDKREGERSAASREVPVSNLPNTHFAHFGRTEGSAEVYVVFPRMRHKHPLRKRWETKIPYEVETFWLQHLVYPALNRLKERGIRPYTDLSFEDVLYKYRGSKDKTILVSPEHLDEIQDTIHQILKENEGKPYFDRFGSLFFVLQILGIKVSTSQDQNWTGLWDKVTRQLPTLDWKYMEDPEHGELLLDLGIGIHPRDRDAVVGFWDVDALRAGFDYGGYTKGTTHSVSTVPAIGGIHSEMGKTRRKRTHIAYRLTYNLVYEVLRGQRTREKESFFHTRSAYEQDQSYKQGIRGLVEAYSRSIHKSFGVRDEYRCRAGSMNRLLPLLEDKAKKYVQELNPIIWLNTAEWFQFVQRRVKELSNFQERLYRFEHPVPNYGVLTSILTHIIQHVGVTPVVLDPDLRLNLTAIRFDAISTRFGCFFLHDLDLTNGWLPEVQRQDEFQMLARMGIKSRKRRREESPPPQLPPSGDALTWKQLGQLVNKGDDRAKVKEFVWDDWWTIYSPARILFCKFTYQYWMAMKDNTFTQLTRQPANLREAMELWTLRSVRQRIDIGNTYHLMPSADQLENNVPPKSRTQLFKTKRKAFFPEPNEILTKNSHWEPFYEVGYMLEYHTAIDDSSPEQAKALKDALDGIFEHLQVLPFNPGRPCDLKPLWRWKEDELQLLLNSSYIDMEDRTLRYKGGQGRERRKGGKHKMRSKLEMKLLLIGDETQPPLRKTKAAQKFIRIETQDLMQGRRGKPKNYRMPPTKRKQPAAEPEEEESRTEESGGEPAEEDIRRITRQKRRPRVESDPESPMDEGQEQEEELPSIAYLEEEEEEVFGLEDESESGDEDEEEDEEDEEDEDEDEEDELEAE